LVNRHEKLLFGFHIFLVCCVSSVRKGGDNVKTKVVIPVSDRNGLNAWIAEHFGRAPFSAALALDEKQEH
jgi:hypothetical protein